MTIKEKILETFPKANFITYDSDSPEEGQPSICAAELGIISGCPCDISCEDCWGLDYDDEKEQLERENRKLREQNRELQKRLDRMTAERGQIENVD
jgi:hypothetical protein